MVQRGLVRSSRRSFDKDLDSRVLHCVGSWFFMAFRTGYAGSQVTVSNKAFSLNLSEWVRYIGLEFFHKKSLK